MKYGIVWIALLIPLGAQAQLPRGLFPWWESALTPNLNLTPEQSRQIREILRDSRARLIDLRAAVEKAEGEVTDQFNEENIDVAKAGVAIDKLVDQRGELMREYSRMALKLRAVLTPQQWRELQRRRPGPPPEARPEGAPPPVLRPKVPPRRPLPPVDE